MDSSINTLRHDKSYKRVCPTMLTFSFAFLCFNLDFFMYCPHGQRKTCHESLKNVNYLGVSCFGLVIRDSTPLPPSFKVELVTVQT